MRLQGGIESLRPGLAGHGAIWAHCGTHIFCRSQIFVEAPIHCGSRIFPLGSAHFFAVALVRTACMERASVVVNYVGHVGVHLLLLLCPAYLATHLF